MPNQPQNSIPLPAPQTTRPEIDRKPAIRTMKSDIEEMFKTTKPSLIKIVGQEVSRAEVRQEKKEQKKYLAIVALGVAMLAILAGASYYFLPQEQEPATPVRVAPPAPFFATEASRTISVRVQDRTQFIRLLADSMQEREREGIIKRVILKIQDGSQERFAIFSDFFGLWRIAPPQDLLPQVEPPLMTFIYYGGDGARLGLAVKVRDLDRALAGMLQWESSLLRDVQPLFFDEKPETVLSSFEDRTYRNIDWRYLKLSRGKDFGIGYAVFPARSLLVITTSKEAMETAINRLFEAR